MKDNHEFRVIRLRELPVDIPCCDTPERIYEYWVANIATASNRKECMSAAAARLTSSPKSPGVRGDW